MRSIFARCSTLVEEPASLCDQPASVIYSHRIVWERGLLDRAKQPEHAFLGKPIRVDAPLDLTHDVTLCEEPTAHCFSCFKFADLTECIL